MIADDPFQWRHPSAYEPTDRDRILTRKLAMLGFVDDEVAERLGISVTTLAATLSADLALGHIDRSAREDAHARWRVLMATDPDRIHRQIEYMRARHAAGIARRET